MEKKDLLNELESRRVSTKMDLKRPDVYGHWLIRSDNSLTFLDLERGFTIPSDTFKEVDWISHLMGKGWMEGHLEDFMKAYWEAMRRQGIGQIIQKVY